MCSQPSLEMTGRVGSSARVSSVSARLYACCAGSCATCCTPHDSLNGTPRDDRRVRHVAPHDVQPLAGQLGDRLVAEPVRARRLGPHRQAEHVAPVQVPRVLDLLVHPDRVEPEVLGQLHLRAQGVGARRGQVRLRPVALLQYGAEVERAVVEQQRRALGRDRAQAAVRLQAVELRAVPEQGDLRVEQHRAVRRPQQPLVELAVGLPGDRDGHLGDRSLDRHLGGAEVLAGPGQPHPDPGARGRGGAQPDLGGHPPARDVGPPRHVRHGHRRHPLQPHRAPDAGGPVVPDRVLLGLPVLLAAGLLDVGAVVGRAHHDDVRVGRGLRVEQVGDVDGERGLAALVPDGVPAVDPHVGLVVDGAEVQQQPVALRTRAQVGGDRERPAVPERRVVPVVADPRGGRLRGERHDDLACEPVRRRRGVPALAQPGVRVVEREGPRPVERPPAVRADELGAGVQAAVGC